MDEILTDTVESPSVDIAPGMSDEAVLDAVVSSHNQAAEEVVAAADEHDQIDPAAEGTDDDGVQEPVQEVPEVPGEEEVAAPAEEKPAEVKAESEDDEAEDDPYETGLTVASLRKKIEATPALKQAIATDPKLRNQLFHSARRAERANQYDEVFQTPALAKEAAQAAASRYKFQDLYNGEDSQKFLESLAQEDFQRDSEGRILLNENNQPISSGRFQSHMSAYRGIWYNSVLGTAQQLLQSNRTFGDGINGNDVMEAVRILQILTEGKSELPGPNGERVEAPADPALPEHVKTQLKELESIKAGKAAEARKNLETFSTRVLEAEKTSLETDVKNLLAKRLPKEAAIGEYLKDKIIADTVASVIAKVKANAAHQAVRSRAIQGATKDDSGIQAVLKLAQSFTKELIPRELARILSAAAPNVVSENAALKAKINAQTNRKEARTSGGVSLPSRPDVQSKAREIESNAKKAGKQVSDMELLDQTIAAVRQR